MLNKFAIVAGLMTVISLAQGSIARADYVSDAIDEANGVASQAEAYNRDVVVPQVIQSEQYLNQLQSLCSQGSTQACNEASALIYSQSQRFDQVLQWQRARLLR